MRRTHGHASLAAVGGNDAAFSDDDQPPQFSVRVVALVAFVVVLTSVVRLLIAAQSRTPSDWPREDVLSAG